MNKVGEQHLKNDTQYEQQISRFETLLALWKDAYQCAVVSFVGLRTAEGSRLFFGRVSLEPTRIGISEERFKLETEHIVAARLIVNAKWSDITSLITNAKIGGIPIAVESSDIHLEKDGHLSAYFDSIHHPLAQDGPRLPCLQIHGISKHSLLSKVIDVRQLDWELKAADEPFDNFDELLSYSMIPMPTPMGDQTTLEIVAKAPAVISGGSIIKREKARIECVIAERIVPKKIKIGYRFPKLGGLTKGAINGSELRWKKKDDTKVGVRYLPVGKAPFLQAFLSYEDIALHQWFITDPAKHLNPRHAIHQVIDKDLEFLNRSILEPGSFKDPAAMFEAGVSSLLYLLGFLATNYGRIPKLQQGPDIIAVTPNGNIGVIECTLGILDENNKLAKLVQRTKLIRDGLAVTGWGHLKVQAAIFTPLPRDGVAGDLEKADKLNILVFSKENLEEMLRRVNTAPNPDKLFQEAMTELTARK